MVILALYDGEKLIEMQKTIYEGEEITFDTDKMYKEAKVMVWDNLFNIKPICDAEIVK